MHPHGHVDLRVTNIELVYPFYSEFLPALGFQYEWKGKGTFSFQTEGKFPRLSWFGVIEEPSHIANANRLAFAVESREEVDRVAEIARVSGARNFEKPENMPYPPRIYYAAYFEDPSGNRLEVYFCED